MPIPPALALAPGVHQLDLRFQGYAGAVAAYVIADGDDVVLVETGPGSTLPALRAALAEAGHEPAALTHVVVTHIHLDHAGAAGSLLREAPRALLHVHPAGAAHLVDPSKLIASATRIYGDDMDRLWGAFEAVPADRVRTIGDGETLHVGRGRRLVALHTPGHAVHHVALHDPELGDVYTGDVAGVRLAGAPFVSPPTPPPDIDLAAWRASVARLRALRANRLLLTHFGPVLDVDWHLDDLLARLFDATGWMTARLELGQTPDEVAHAIEARNAAEIGRALAAAGPGAIDPAHVGGAPDAALDATPDDAALLPRLVRGYELANPSHMAVGGVARWLKTRDRAPRDAAPRDPAAGTA